ncbi:MAG: DinB family protein [Spirochaetota bacterium]|nr:DinB family protein [Spirochaetota bacterium]
MIQHELQIILQQLGNHLKDLEGIINRTSEEKLCYKPDPNRWSPKEVLGHLFDVELVFNYRLRKIIEEDVPTIHSFSQNIWVEEQQYNEWDTAILLNALIYLRRNLTFWLSRVRENDWERSANHPKRGRVTFKSTVELLASHFEHHLMQIKDRVKQ